LIIIFSRELIEKKGENVDRDIVISIVDDDESLRKALKRLIKSIGLCVEDFASAEDFLRSGSSQNTTCLILDLRLPGISGLELQSLLIASNCHVPIVFISAQYDQKTRTRALQAGAIDFLQKPFKEDALLNAINSSIRSNRNQGIDAPTLEGSFY
jgi:FixJ family two-component response regulator